MTDSKTDMKTFGNRLYKLRNQSGLSQLDLAKKIGSSKGTIQNYESGTLPKGEYAIRLARFFDCSIDWLLTGRDVISEREIRHDDGSGKDIDPETLKQMLAEHQNIIQNFEDPETGLAFISLLLELESLNPKEYYMLFGYAKRVLTEAEFKKDKTQDVHQTDLDRQKKIS